MLSPIPTHLIPSTLLILLLWAPDTLAQGSSGRPTALAEERFKSGSTTMRAFRPVVDTARRSVVKIELDGKTVALGAIIDTNGIVVTKASELKEGTLKCELWYGVEVDAEKIASDEDNDLALLKIKADDLRPIEWMTEDASVGQWVATAGIERTPEAIGVVSVPPRKILPKRAIIGVRPDPGAPTTKIAAVMPGFGADKAGLKAGDVILQVNAKPVKTWEALSKTLRQFREGQTVNLLVQRDDDEFEAEVQMMPEQSAFAAVRGSNRQDVMNRMGGKLSERAEGFQLAIQHDTVLQPWQCGGPLINLEGKAIGLNIARAGRVASYALPAALVRQIAEELKGKIQ